MSEKNVIFTTLSKKPMKCFPNTYYIERGDCKYFCEGVQQQEPGTKLFLSESRIDKIVVTGSEETYNDVDFENNSETLENGNRKMSLSDWCEKGISEDNYSEKSTLAVFLSRIADFYFDVVKSDATEDGKRLLRVQEEHNNNDVEVIFVHEKDKNGNDNIFGIVNALKGEDCDVKLYMDMQGGQRTAIYVNNALLQLLGKQSKVYRCELMKVVATNFTPGEKKHRIVDETDRYKIVNLVSGINAFISYGKTDILYEYYKSLSNPGENVKNLIHAMIEIDHAITYSRFDEEQNDEDDNSREERSNLRIAVKKLRNAIKMFDDDTGNAVVTLESSIFNILIDGIKADYGDLIKGDYDDEIDVISLADWCVRKSNYTSAAIIIETYFPSFFVKHGVLYYANTKPEMENVLTRFKFYKSVSNEQYKFNNINHFFIKYYVKDCGVFFGNSNKNEPEYEYKCYKSPVSNLIFGSKKGSYPIKFYSDYEEKDFAYKILVRYSFISRHRNSFAHGSSNGKEVNNLIECMKELIADCREIQNNNKEWVLPDDELKGGILIRKKKEKVKEEKEKVKELWVKAIEQELKGDSEYGMMTWQVSKIIEKELEDKKIVSKRVKVYAMRGLIFDLIEYSKLNCNLENDNNLKEIVDFFKKTKWLGKRIIDKYISENGESITYEEVCNFKIEQCKQYDDKATLTEIKRNLDSREGFLEVAKNAQDDATWKKYIEQKKEEYNKAAAEGKDGKSEEMKNYIRDIIQKYLDDKGKWKELIDLDNAEVYNDLVEAYFGLNRYYK